MKRTIRLLSLMAISCLILAACGAKVNNDVPGARESESVAESEANISRVFTLAGKEITLGLPEYARVEYADGSVSVTLPSDVADVDLTPLSELGTLSEIAVNAAGFSIGRLALAPCEALCVEAKRVEKLDASGANDLTGLTMYGDLGSADLPESLVSIERDGGDLSIFADLPGINSVILTAATDLSPLAGFASLKRLTLIRAEDGEKYDLTALAGVKFDRLAILGGVTAEELAGAAGAQFTAMQVNDEYISDLSVLEKLASLDTLLLAVSPDQPEALGEFNNGEAVGAEQIALLNTPIPKDQLTAYAAHGELFIFFDSFR